MEKKISKAKGNILQFIENKGISKREFYQKTGLSNGILDKNSGLNENTLEKVISAYPQINPTWLLTGEGNETRPRIYDVDKKKVVGLGVSPVNEPKIDYLKEHKSAVPYYDIDISAGLMELFNDEKETPSGWVNFPDFPKSNAVVNAYSDSMSDYINNGDKIAIRLINDLQIIEYGQCFVIVTEDYRFVKFIRKSDTPDNIKLVSYNSAYDDFEIPKSKILKLFLVTYVFKPTAN
jgi:phage repressor protein C with HTH and peptisase S24 domain